VALSQETGTVGHIDNPPESETARSQERMSAVSSKASDLATEPPLSLRAGWSHGHGRHALTSEDQMQDYRPGIELVVPPYVVDGDQHKEFIFMIAEVLPDPAPPGHVHVLGRIGADAWNTQLRLPLGLQRAAQGVLYGLHAYVPRAVRGYVLEFQGASRDAPHRP